MSELKCPICNSNLIITCLCDGIFPNPNKGKIDEIFCDKCKTHGTEELWQELIRTRKALDVAIKKLTIIRDSSTDDNTNYLAGESLDEIKQILETKE